MLPRLIIPLLIFSLMPAVPPVAHGAEPGDGEVSDGEPDRGSDGEPDAPAHAWQLWLRAEEGYRFRHASAPRVETVVGDEDPEAPGPEADHDLRLLLAGGLADPTDRFAVDLSTALWWDLDGVPASREPSALRSVQDGTTTPVWFDVFSLHGEYRSPGALALARVGRQTADHGRQVVFDGGALRLRLIDPQLELFAFGGRKHHFFEIDDDYFEDWLASAGAVVRPLPGLRLEVDYRFLEEDTLEREGLMQHSYGAAAWFLHDDWLRLRAHFRGLDDRPSRAGGAAGLEWVAGELGLELSADAQLVTLGETGELDDPFFSVLGESLPHVLARAELWKAFTTHAGVYTAHAGWDGRILTEHDPTLFNRDHGRVYLWLQAVDIGVAGPFAGVVGEYHYTHRASGLPADDLFTVGGSLGWDRRPVRVELGTDYARFKYDYYVDVEERADVRTYFADVGAWPLDWLRVRVRYELEQFDRTVHTALLTLTQTY
ncbi:MAG: hypothetical protein JRI55_19955 [Deltaproteobacteria bacterium]|jgi:hypothetical protein|nr:hypothetical protein [Deltaproteobacteria bacterium]